MNKTPGKLRSFFQKSAVKVVLSIVLFVLFTGVITYAVAFPYDKIFSTKNNFELVVLGASESMWGADTKVLKADTGMETCILASERCDFQGRIEMLKAAIQQSSLDLVVLEVSNTAFAADLDPIKERYFTKVSGLRNKLGTVARQFSFWDDEYDILFAETLNSGLMAWGAKLDGTYQEQFDLHGYEPQPARELPDSAEDMGHMKDFMSTDLNYDYTRLDDIREIVQMCRDNGKDIIIVTFPVSSQSNWMFSGWDHFRDLMTDLTDILDVPYYDFNLLENKYDYLPDEGCFRDIEHLSTEGAEVFGHMLAELINAHRNGTEYGYRFYDTYEEAKEHNYYQQFVA